MLTFSDGDLYKESREIMNQMGEIYRKLQARFGENLEIEIIDPRNSVSFFITLIREKRTRGIPLRSFIYTALFGLSKQSVIINGELFSKGVLPSFEEIEEHIQRVQSGGA